MNMTAYKDKDLLITEMRLGLMAIRDLCLSNIEQLKSSGIDPQSLQVLSDLLVINRFLSKLLALANKSIDK